MPAPSPHSFLALCKSAKISLPTTAANMKKFLESAGTLPILGSPRVDGLRERCAAVAWVQNAVANKLDPDTWSSTLDASLLPTLLSLYNLPPATSSGGPPQSELVRLARSSPCTFPPMWPTPPLPPAMSPSSILLARTAPLNHQPRRRKPASRRRRPSRNVRSLLRASAVG